MLLIPLTCSKFAKIDDSDYPLVSSYCWQYSKLKSTEYARATMKSIRMHRLIMGAKPGEEIDHRNGDGLDNRRCNLRFCMRSQNVCNTSKRKDSPNQYKGVHQVRSSRKWIARIQVNGKRLHSMSCQNELQAAFAYDDLARKYFGQFARLNFPA